MSRYLDVFPLCQSLVLFLFSLRITGHLPNIQALVGLSTVFFLTDLAYRARTYQLELYEQKNPELHEILEPPGTTLIRKILFLRQCSMS